MSTMTARAGLPWGRPLTVQDLEEMPDDGHRYELIDGTLIVSPAPGWPHQGADSARRVTHGRALRGAAVPVGSDPRPAL